MKDKLWELARRNHPIGKILPVWLKVIRWILYPLDTFYWSYGSKNGYNPNYDEWLIEGIRYTGSTLRVLSRAQGETYKITRVGECVKLESVE